MPELYYTAVIKDGKVLVEDLGEGRKFTYAEHFESPEERDKRAKQFAQGVTPSESTAIYLGTEPPEAWLARAEYLNARPFNPDATEAQIKVITDKADEAALAAGKKTVSVLTPPEVDDREARTELPAWAVAQAEVERAERFVIDAKEAHLALQKRADNLAEEAYSTDAQSYPEDVKMQYRQRAVRAQAEADQAQARLYHAEGDYAAKAATYKSLMDAEQEGKK